MHKHHMSLTRVPVARNGHTLPCAHYKLYTHDSNQRANTLYCQERLHQGDTTLHAVWTLNLVSGMWQYGIDQWVGQDEFLYGTTKEERLAKKTQEVDSQI